MSKKITAVALCAAATLVCGTAVSARHHHHMHHHMHHGMMHKGGMMKHDDSMKSDSGAMNSSAPAAPDATAK